jgi:hypothetical protein
MRDLFPLQLVPVKYRPVLAGKAESVDCIYGAAKTGAKAASHETLDGDLKRQSPRLGHRGYRRKHRIWAAGH